MSTYKNYIFIGLKVIAWIIFVGLCIEAGALVVNFVMSIFNPAIVKNLYEKLDLSDVYQKSTWVYYGIYSFIIALAVLKCLLFYYVIKLTMVLNLANPFVQTVADLIRDISQLTFSIGIISYIGQQIVKSHEHKGMIIHGIDRFWADSEAFILMAAVVYVIATIFARGVELQNENEYTI